MKKKSFRNSPYVSIFPYYQFDDLFPFSDDFSRVPAPDCYKEFNISVFDHYLDREKYEEKKLTCDYFYITYDSFYKKKYLNKKMKNALIYYKLLEDKFLAFFNFLYEEGVYMILSDKYLVEFSGKKEYFRHCLYGIRERHNRSNKSRSFIVPSLGVIISSAWDHKHIVHASKEYYKKDTFEKIVKEAGLFVLE